MRKVDALFLVLLTATAATVPALSAAILATRLLLVALERAASKRVELSYLTSAYAFAFTYLTGLERGVPSALNAVLALGIEPYAADLRKLKAEALRGRPLQELVSEYAERVPVLPSRIAVLSSLGKQEKLGYIRELVAIEVSEKISAYLSAASLAVVGNYLLLLMLLMLLALGRVSGSHMLVAAISAFTMEVGVLEYWSRTEAEE